MKNGASLHPISADKQERAQVQRLCQDVQQATGHTVQLAWADQGYTGEGCIEGGAGPRDRPADREVA